MNSHSFTSLEKPESVNSIGKLKECFKKADTGKSFMLNKLLLTKTSLTALLNKSL